jgi:hypothetical protein
LIVRVAGVVLALALIVGGTFYTLFALASTTVTIIPTSRNVSNTYTFTAAPGTPDASRQQVGARLVSATTPAQKKTTNASGHLSLQATQARGMLVLRNWDKVPKTFVAGTVLPDWSADEVINCGDAVSNMVIDATVTVPTARGGASNYGTAYAPAHVLEPGVLGNIPATIGPNSCWYYIWAKGSCPSGWFGRACWTITTASNFTGGQDAYDGPAVQRSDIDDAANTLIERQPNPQQVLQPKLKANERLIGTPQCSPRVTADHQAGDHADQVTVHVTFACNGEVYDYNGALAMAAEVLTQQAAVNPGEEYALAGTIKATVTAATLDSQGTATLTVRARGVWAYQFSEAQKQALARLIAGKSVPAAQQLLARQQGVVQVSFHVPFGGQTLPSDLSRITIAVQAPPGA